MSGRLVQSPGERPGLGPDLVGDQGSVGGCLAVRAPDASLPRVSVPRRLRKTVRKLNLRELRSQLPERAAQWRRRTWQWSRRRTWVLPGGLLGPIGPQGPARGAGLLHSREAGLAWAEHRAAGRAVLGSSLEEEEVGAVAGGAVAGVPLTSLELETPQSLTVNLRSGRSGADRTLRR